MTESTPNLSGFQCPVPILRHSHVQLAHGGGGRLMQELIEHVFWPAFGQKEKAYIHDAAVLKVPSGQLAYTTDSYVIRPLFFPGGNIGELAVYGTVNDLAMAGARPLYLSVGFILEEGLAMTTLVDIVQSMASAAKQTQIQIVTGDTKVVDRGKGDGIFINTSGIGVIEHPLQIHPTRIVEGDAVLINGDLARHGMAVMAQREGLQFESTITSDSAPLSDLVQALLRAGIEIHCLRDLTRGGLASGLNELAQASSTRIVINEKTIPVREDVASACELLGLDPLYVANEGRCVAFIPMPQAQPALKIMQSHPQGQGSVIIGHVEKSSDPTVLVKTRIGVHRILDMLSGEQLPRIC